MHALGAISCLTCVSSFVTDDPHDPIRPRPTVVSAAPPAIARPSSTPPSLTPAVPKAAKFAPPAAAGRVVRSMDPPSSDRVTAKSHSSPSVAVSFDLISLTEDNPLADYNFGVKSPAAALSSPSPPPHSSSQDLLSFDQPETPPPPDSPSGAFSPHLPYLASLNPFLNAGLFPTSPGASPLPSPSRLAPSPTTPPASYSSWNPFAGQDE